MMFEKNKLYKHVNCLDICFRPQEINQQENGSFLLKGLWLNQHYDMLVICSDEIVITQNNIHQWRELNVE